MLIPFNRPSGVLKMKAETLLILDKLETIPNYQRLLFVNSLSDEHREVIKFIVDNREIIRSEINAEYQLNLKLGKES